MLNQGKKIKKESPVSYSRHERGEFIRTKMQHYILMELGTGKINADKAGHIFDLISDVETAGTTHNKELATHEFYLKALKEWQAHLQKKKDRFMNARNL